MKDIMAGDYRVFRRGKKIVAHHASCDEPSCRENEISITASQLDKLLAGKLKRVMQEGGGHLITYSQKEIKIGCTIIPKSILKRIAKL